MTKCDWCGRIVVDGSPRHSYCTPDPEKGTKIKEERYRVYGGKRFWFLRVTDPVTKSVWVAAFQERGRDYSLLRHSWERTSE